MEDLTVLIVYKGKVYRALPPEKWPVKVEQKPFGHIGSPGTALQYLSHYKDNPKVFSAILEAAFEEVEMDRLDSYGLDRLTGK